MILEQTYRQEFADHRFMLESMGVNEADYIASRRLDEQVDAGAPSMAGYRPSGTPEALAEQCDREWAEHGEYLQARLNITEADYRRTFAIDAEGGIVHLAERCELQEQFSGGLVEFDAAAGVLRNIVLCGPESKNGYRYSETAMRGAISKYDGAHVFLDHSDGRRGVRELAGVVTNPRYVEGRIRGDVRPLNNAAGKELKDAAAAGVKGVGMSHVITGTMSRDKKTVETIDHVRSVDLVVNPATTSSLSESDATNS